MASMAFTELVFGKGTPFSNFTSLDSIKQINRQRLREFHNKFVRPDGALFAVTGSLPKSEVKQAIEERFGDWAPGALERGKLPKVEYQIKPGIYVLERDFDQASVIIGHRGPSRHTKDRYAIAVFNQIYGHGSFSSLLFREVRSELGLAYSVYGGVWPDLVEGTFQVMMGTRADQAKHAINAVIAKTDQVRANLVKPEDFDAAKSAIERSFVFKFADPSFVAQRAVILEVLGYPKNYDEQYLKNMEIVSREQVNWVANSRIHPQDYVIVIVGRVSAEEFSKEFAGEMDVYRLSFDTEPNVEEKL
jgi:zinc protease